MFPSDLPAYKGEVPDEDVHESSAKGPDAPSAPPISSMDRVAGYESVTMQGGTSNYKMESAFLVASLKNSHIIISLDNTIFPATHRC